MRRDTRAPWSWIGLNPAIAGSRGADRARCGLCAQTGFKGRDATRETGESRFYARTCRRKESHRHRATSPTRSQEGSRSGGCPRHQAAETQSRPIGTTARSAQAVALAPAGLLPRSNQNNEGAVNRQTSRADALINALNDRSRTTIGNPWNGTYNVTIDITNHGDADELLSELGSLGVSARVNVGYVDRIAIYDLASIENLVALGEFLDERTMKRLRTLITARGPVPENLVLRIADFRSMEWSFGRIAAYLNEKRIPDGMGGRGWTSKKVEAAWQRKVPRRLRKLEAA